MCMPCAAVTSKKMLCLCLPYAAVASLESSQVLQSYSKLRQRGQRRRTELLSKSLRSTPQSMVDSEAGTSTEGEGECGVMRACSEEMGECVATWGSKEDRMVCRGARRYAEKLAGAQKMTGWCAEGQAVLREGKRVCR